MADKFKIIEVREVFLRDRKPLEKTVWEVYELRSFKDRAITYALTGFSMLMGIGLLLLFVAWLADSKDEWEDTLRRFNWDFVDRVSSFEKALELVEALKERKIEKFEVKL